MRANRFCVSTLLAGVVTWATGCVEHRTVYVPVYQPAPVAVQAPPSTGQAATVVSPTAANAPPPQPAAAAPVVVTQAPPPAQVEVVPVAPGPDYVWTPGYWTWQGGWVWVGGCYVIGPRPHAVWIGGRWARHGRGYVWIGGHWH